MGRIAKPKVKNHLSKIAKLHKSDSLKKTRFSRVNLVIFTVIFACIGGYLLLQSRAAGPCTSHVTTSNFASTFSNSAGGATICLASGNYGNFNGGVKSAPGVTITSDSSVGGTQANVIFTSLNLGGSQNIIFDNITIGQNTNTALNIQSNVTNIVITNSIFKGFTEIDNLQNTNHTNLLFDRDDFSQTGVDCSDLQANAIIGLHYSGAAHSGVTVQNSVIGNSDCDGIHTGTGIDVLNNEFKNICENGPNDPQHTDHMQFEGSNGGRIAGNFFHSLVPDSVCITQALTSFDSGTVGVIIENNVMDTSRGFGVEFYGDKNSIIRHNTVVYRSSGCATGACRGISISCRDATRANGGVSQCPPNWGVGTQVYDNLAFPIDINHEGTQGPDAQLGRNDHNFSAQGVTFAGCSSGACTPPAGGFASFNDYLLKSTSTQKGTASDGTDPGIYTAGVLCSNGTGSIPTTITPTNFASAVAAATTGQTICLSNGDYGTFAGTNKAIIIAAATGATPQMKFNFGSGDSGFTLDGMTNMGGVIAAGAANITIKNSVFSRASCYSIGCVDIEGSMTNIVLDSNDFTFAAGPTCGAPNSKIFTDTSGSSPGSALIIKNNSFANGDLDGVHIGGGSGLLVENNTFKNLIDNDQPCLNGVPQNQSGCGNSPACTNHTDHIQFQGGSQIIIRGNFIQNCTNGCPTQGITSFDSNTNGVIIENNVVDIPRPWGIELYSDTNSIVRHNTVVWHADANCDFTGIQCGQIDINRKSTDPIGSGTQVYDNITTSVAFNNSSTGTAHHNVSGQTAVYQGGASPTTHDGYLLASSSPVGRNAASDGKDIGIYAIGGGTTPPPPSDSTPPTVSITAPTSGATVSGATVTLSANASDNVGVSGVQFKVDGNNVGNEDTSSPYSITWDSRVVSNGTHTITAVARDAAGNTTTSSTINVTVNNATTCKQSDTGWQNSSFATQTGSFTFDFDATPSATNIDALTGLSSGAATDYANLGAIVLFSDTGAILARNGGAYAAVSTLNYTAGTSYHIKMTVNVSSHTYSVTATPSGGSAVTIATNYAFRTEQASVANLNNWSIHSNVGTETICGATLNQSGTSKVGDINNDNQVNITDLSLLLSSYGQSTTQCITNTALKCDLSSPGDGVVNIFDLSILLSKYGT